MVFSRAYHQKKITQVNYVIYSTRRVLFTVARKGHYNIVFFCLSYRPISLNYRAIISQFAR